MDFSKMMREAQKLQQEMMAAQKKIETFEVEGSSAGGLVSLTLTGGNQMRQLHIDESLLRDREMLEDLVIAAYHDAYQKLEEKKAIEMSSVNAKMPAGLKSF
jgi:nucleoid-associated protein EbfC